MPLYYALESYDGYRLRTILLEKGISPTELSRRARGGVSASTIKNMLHQRRPTVREGTIHSLARALYVDEEILRGGGRVAGTGTHLHRYRVPCPHPPASRPRDSLGTPRPFSSNLARDRQEIRGGGLEVGPSGAGGKRGDELTAAQEHPAKVTHTP